MDISVGRGSGQLRGEVCEAPYQLLCRGSNGLRTQGFWMDDDLQARVEDEWFVVLLICELKICTVRIDCISEVGPERKVLSCKQDLSLDWVDSTVAVNSKDFVSDYSSNDSWEKSSNWHMQSLECQYRQWQSPRSLHLMILTTKARKPSKAPPVYLSCSELLTWVRILCLSVSSR